MKPVTDPALLSQLDAPTREVSDPALLAQLEAPEAPPQPERGFLESAGRNVVGGLEAAAQFGTGALAGAAGGLAGIGTGINRSLGLTQQEPAEAVRGVSSALTYQPKTPEGVRLSEIVNYPFEKIAEGADYVGGNVTDVTGDPTLGMQAVTTLQGIPMLFGGARGRIKGAVQRAETEAAGKASAASERNATLDAARAEGYRVPPSASGAGGFATNRAESLAGKAATQQEASVRNQAVTDKIGRREAGLNENEPISRRTLEEARERLSEPYREVAAVSPDAAGALEVLKEVRRDASDAWAKYARDPSPSVRKEAQALTKEAAQWESFIDAEAVKAGRPDLLPKLRQARQNIAKNHDVEKALNIGTGSLDATVWGRMLDKKRPLSGGLETAGRFAEGFDKFVQPDAINKGAGISKIEATMAALLAGGGAAVAGPAGLGAGALAFAPHAIRPMLLSDMAQMRPKYRPNATMRLLDAISKAPIEASPAESGSVRLRDLRLQGQ